MKVGFSTKRTIEELKDLRSLTGDENGAQRVAFTDKWASARAWLKAKLDPYPSRFTPMQRVIFGLHCGASRTNPLIMGGHIDSVPNGGWLDGCLNTLAGLESPRRIVEQYGEEPPVTIRLVDWADEEGARFGKSLLALQPVLARWIWMRFAD